MENFYELAMSRKSVRSYDGRPLTAEDAKKLLTFMETPENPFGIPVSMKLLEAGEHGLSSPVISGEKFYAAGTVGRVPHGEEAFGYAFERLVLYAWSLGVGTVWIGGTMNRETFEQAVGLRAEERMPCVSPLGYPAKKRSLRDSLMRKGIRADERKPLTELFFDSDFSTPLAAGDGLERTLEAVRWAPSAVNRQPWRILRRDGLWHFYLKRSAGMVNDAVGELQRIDLGIALCHFMLGAEEAGLSPKLVLEDPGVALPEDMAYSASVSLA
ncbi:MAG: nitroreductase family protein [Oscillospiraceae bacterium]|nr:nitroreductase family protein [Oscillospiraceae bacterium]